MIELKENQYRDFDRQSSKGNQMKWFDGHKWYKADYTGYEGLAEYMVSNLLLKSSLKNNEYVVYDLEQIKYKRSIYSGVSSDNFLDADWEIITLERLYKARKGAELLPRVWRYVDYEDRAKFLVNEITSLTGIKDFGIYLSKMLTIDAFFLNEDRHMHNIAVLMNENEDFKLCPIFDNGAALLSDTTVDYPIGADIIEMITEPKSKTICSDFDEQLSTVEKLYGYNIDFYFTKKDVDNLLEQAIAYPADIIERVRTILYQRIRKFQYLFKIE